jgi:hypothetical protein
VAISLAVVALALMTMPRAGFGFTAAADPPAENVTFWYQDLKPSTDLTPLGHPAIVVLGPQTDEAGAVARVHALGAKAYRYVQYYWLPSGQSYQGVDLATHPDWAFCRTGATKAEGRVASGIPWYLLDLNERPARDAMLAFTAQVQAWGYDGVMIDRGYAALTAGTDGAGNRIWNRRSTCTADPVVAGRTFADAYVGLTASIHDLGLEVMFNYATSPNDAKLALRPDPSDPRCNLPTTATVTAWAQCPRLSDVWPVVTSVLVENFGKTTDERWLEDYRTGAEAEAKQHPVVGLLKESEVDPAKQRANAYYQWARAKLFPTALAMNVGDDRCNGNGTSVCQRNGLFPELVDARLGAPTRAQPVASQCVPGTLRCLYTRTYQLGTVAANASPRPAVTQVLPTPTQDLVEQYSGQVVTHASCGAGVPQPAWSGRLFMARPNGGSAQARRGAVLVDGWGGVHSFAVGACGAAAVRTNGGPYWVGWDIVRGIALRAGSTGGYVLDGYGGLHPFGMGTNAPPPPARSGPYWLGTDIARGVAMLPDGTGGYVLDGAGGLHPFAVGANPLPPAARGNAYWAGWDIARGVGILPDGSGGYVVDGWGGLHPFAIGGGPVPPAITGGPYWPGWDIVRGVSFLPGGRGGYVLDGWGGLHPLPDADGWQPPLQTSAPYWPGWTIAHGLALATAASG